MDNRGKELDLNAKKAVLRSFTYGLFAISANHNGETGIFTANWITQVSFEPPMVALSVERDSSTLPLIQSSGRFAVAPFREGQRDLAGDLGRPKSKAGDKVAMLGDQVVVSDSGVVAFGDGLGYCVCNVVDTVEVGDSVLFVAEVIEAVTSTEGSPLTMRDAGFRHFG